MQSYTEPYISNIIVLALLLSSFDENESSQPGDIVELIKRVYHASACPKIAIIVIDMRLLNVALSTSGDITYTMWKGDAWPNL